MRKIIFLITVMVLISAVNVSAQSKKELKAMAKIQEEVNATTTTEGLRFFKIKSTHISYYVKSCYHSDGAVIIEMLVENRNWNDEYLELYGEGGEYEYKTGAKDDNDKFYWAKYFSFAIGNSNDFKGSLSKVLIPAEGSLKVKIKIKDVGSDVAKFKDLYFGYKAALEGITMTREAKLKELEITR